LAHLWNVGSINLEYAEKLRMGYGKHNVGMLLVCLGYFRLSYL